MAKFFELTFVAERISARARLFEKEAPKTVETLWRLAPFESPAGHAIFSGTTAAVFLDPTVTVPMENATSQIQKGDLMFTHYDPMTRFGYAEPISEIYWAYDRFCRSVMPGTHIPNSPNISGAFIGDHQIFFDLSRRLPTEGPKKVRITRVET